MAKKRPFYMDRPTTKYIRKRDIRKFDNSKIGMFRNALLIKYYGTIEEANKKRVPVYDRYGNLRKTSFAYKEQKRGKKKR